MIQTKVRIFLKNTFFPVMVLGMIFIHTSCQQNPHQVDTSEIVLDIDIKRFDLMQQQMDDPSGFQQLYDSFPWFADIYFSRIIGDITGRGLPVEEQYRNYREFLLNEDVQSLFAEVAKQYPDLSDIEEDLEQSLKYMKYHLPDAPIPHFVSFVAPFRVANPFSDEFVGIGLDMYLGRNFEPYAMPPMDFPMYMIKKLDRKYMRCNTMRSVGSNLFPPVANKGRLLDEMIYEGKLLYFLDLTCPEEADSLKIGYFRGQIEWNKENEFQIWDHLIQSNMLYSTDRNYYIRYLSDGPFTVAKGVPQEASPMIANWVGWQIVRAYMERNPETGLKELMLNHDADLILKKSGYRP